MTDDTPLPESYTVSDGLTEGLIDRCAKCEKTFYANGRAQDHKTLTEWSQ